MAASSVPLLLLLCLLGSCWASSRLSPSVSYRALPELSQLAPHHLRGVPPQPSTLPRASEDYLLPDTLVPLSYDVSIVPYITEPAGREMSFDGEVTMRVDVLEETSVVVMHAWDLAIESVQVVKVMGGTVPVSSFTLTPPEDDRQFFTVQLEETLEVGQQYDVTSVYNGTIHNDLFGVFFNTYTDSQGNTRYLVVTDLEPTGARRVLPCMDQPNLKAVFTLHLAQEPGRELLGSMDVQSGGSDPVPGMDGWTWTHFNPTPPMSTYLFCFASHQYSSQEIGKYKVWVRDEAIDEADFSMAGVPLVVEYFEQQLAVPYELPKLDNIALLQFASGAMENWGLITYREKYLVFDPTRDTVWDKQLVAQLLAHEIAHQWFGNLVSPAWWSDLWLNEGFATYYEYRATEAIGPTWEMEEQFVLDVTHWALQVDARPTTHPLYQTDLASPDSINGAFDSITYNKGGCIVRFMINHVGDTKFRSAMSEYLQAMSHQVSTQDVLFEHLAAQDPALPPGVSFAEMMNSWTLQAGFPLVTVTRNYGEDSALIAQERFGTLGPERWVVPLTWTNQSALAFDDLSVQGWLVPQGGALVAEAPPADQWMLLNLQSTGFYRVNYDPTNWALLASYMTESQAQAYSVHVLNRAQLIDDSMALAMLGRLGYGSALATTSYLHHETALVPIITATDNLKYIRNRMYQTPEGVSLFHGYLSGKLDTAYTSVNGFEIGGQDSHVTLLLRWHVTRWACDMSHAACNAAGLRLFRLWQVEADPDLNNPVAVDLRLPAYCAGQRRGGLADYDFLMDRYASASRAQERDRILLAMGCASDISILQQYLAAPLTGQIAPGDALKVLRYVSDNPDAIDLSLDFLITYWQQLEPLYGNIGLGFAELAGKLNTQQHYDKISQFRADNSGSLSTAAHVRILASLNDLQDILAWNFAHFTQVLDYFRQAATTR